jgi:2-hydroxychromene-2-carboxylate isomerase
VFTRNFLDDREIASRDVVAKILEPMGLDAGYWIEQAQTEGNKQQLRIQTEEAQSAGIFGAPTFMVGGDMFWGNDRLEDAIACAMGAP